MDELYLKRWYDSVKLGEVCHCQDVSVVWVRSHVCELSPERLVPDADGEDDDTVVSRPLGGESRLFRSVGLPVCQDDGYIRNFRSITIGCLGD